MIQIEQLWIFAFGKDPSCSPRPEARFGDFCLRQRSLLLQIPNQQALRSYRCSAAFPFPRALGFLPLAKIPPAPNSEPTSPAQLSLLSGFSISPRPEASFGRLEMKKPRNFR